jgi:peptidyl-prolyl cis-trans isomerase A (cyclophilin A)
MFRRIACAASLLIVMLAGCTEAESKATQVEFETSLGNFVVETWPDKAPVTSENFVQYVTEGHFDGLTFHRIAPGFVVQGGGYLPDHQTLRETRDPIVNEASISIKNLKWTLSMARTNSPDSATSQFFINLVDNQALDKTASSAGYAVFGQVVSGFDVIEAMTKVTPGESFGAGGFFPAEPIVIKSAKIISGVKPAPLPAAPEPFACPIGPAPSGAPLSADLITSGVLCITNVEEYTLAWARNTGTSSADITWALTGMPDGWTAAFDDATQTVPSGDKAKYTVLTVTVPEGTSGAFNLSLETGSTTTSITAHVDLRHGSVAKVGDSVTVKYAGRCVSTGNQFDSGEFPLTLGGGRAIAGFDLGLIGMGKKEAASLYLVTPMAYGPTSGPCAGDNADMIFDVTML